MVSLFEPKTTQVAVSQQQQHDLEKTHLFLTVMQQLQQIQSALELGHKNEGMISDLHDVLLTTYVLLQMGTPTPALYSLEAVRFCRAETFRTIARCYEGMGEADQALSYAQRAEHLYHCLEDAVANTLDDESFQSFRTLLLKEPDRSQSWVKSSTLLFNQLLSTGIQTAYSLQRWDFAVCWIEMGKQMKWQLFQQSSVLQQENQKEPLQPSFLRNVQAQLAEDEGVLYYHWLDCDQLLLVTIDAEQVLCRRQWFSSAEQGMLAEVNQSSRQGQPIPREQMDRLSELVLPCSLPDPVAQAQTALLQQKSRLLMSVDDGLQHVPFQVLPWQGEFLIQHFALTQIPHLSSLLWPYESSSKGPVLAVTTQSWAEQMAEGFAIAYESVGVPATILSGTENTASISTLELLADIGALQHYHTLHFATQGNKTIAGESLSLQDAELSSLDITNWQLNAELVILEVNTDLAQDTMAIAPNHFSSTVQGAFLAAGAKRLVNAAGNVPQDISSKIMAGFHGYLARGEAIEVALQKTLQDSLQESQMSGAPVGHQWTPYTLFAVGRAA